MAHAPLDPPALSAELAALLAGALQVPLMPAGMQARLRERVLAQATAHGMRVVRADAGHWELLLPGVSIKRLRLDTSTGIETTLWRLDVGARIPAHAHSSDEECLVLQGSIVQEGTEYHVGDYLHALAGSDHAAIEAPTGALLMIRSPPVASYLA
jgi:anti-sigma factor ChrR (cupin superfamily)